MRLINSLNLHNIGLPNNIEIVRAFYKALNEGDYLKANGFYHPEATYNDEIFSFKGIEIHALWYRATLPDMKLTANLESIREEDGKVITEWEMAYTIDVISRRIILKEIGTFHFLEDKIIEHTDEYDFWLWCAQAFGLIGKAFGWSGWLRNRVRNQARKSVLAHLYSAQESFLKK